MFLGLLVCAATAITIDTPVAVFMSHLPYNIWLERLKAISVLGIGASYILVFLVGSFLFFLISLPKFLSQKRKIQLMGISHFFTYGLATFIASGFILNILKFMIGRQRPYLSPDFNAFIISPFSFSHHFQSFPSGHTQVVFTFAFLVSERFPRSRYLVFFYAAVIAFTRVLRDSHFVSDVFGGIIVAWLGFIVSKTYLKSRVSKWFAQR